MIFDGHDARRTNYRLLLALTFATVLFIFVKLSGMQIFSGSAYRKASEQNGIRAVPISAPRGIIKDRHGTVLVKNRPSYSIYLVPYEVKNLDSASVRLAKVLGRQPDEIKEQIKLGWQGHFRPIRLKRDVEFNTVCYVEEHALDFPGVIFQSEPTRLYPTNNYGAHLWGYVGEVTETDLASEAYSDYNLGDISGKEGLEKQYEKYLRGQNGLKYLEVTAGGKVLGELEEKPRIDPIQGSEVTLEIDWDLQKIAEEELSIRGSGAVVAMDPRDGAVRVLCSVPNFDANLFSGVISPEAWNQVLTDSLHPLFSRGIKGTYPPGSTMKPFTAAMGLENKLITKDSYFEPCLGHKRFGNRDFKCWLPGGHGKLNLVGAITQSCDVYFYQLGDAGGLDLWSAMAKACRFGVKTGIDLPGEFDGLVPSAEYFDSRYGKNGWTRYLVINLAIGQGELLVTPVQMAAMYAALGNGGVVYKPRIVSHITGMEAGLETRVEPEIMGHLEISPANLEILREGLIDVVNGEKGTAHGAALKNIVVAGKTGTAQNPHGEDHAWFVCFAPAENPEIAIAVLVENAGHGGSVAAPLARKILERYFAPDTLMSADIGGDMNHE